MIPVKSKSAAQRIEELERDPLHLEAVRWLVRLQDPSLSLEESLEWQRWIGADARHAQAFARVEAIWQEPWEMLRDSSASTRARRVASPSRFSRTLTFSLAASVL